MGTAFVIGGIYFALIFSLAFAMGVVRVVFLAPRIGAMGAVLLEIPIVLAVSWRLARRLLRHRGLTLAQRAVMGATAFALTLASEVVLARLIGGRSLAAWAAALATPVGMVGLAGQIAFGAAPIFAGRQGRRT